MRKIGVLLLAAAAVAAGCGGGSDRPPSTEDISGRWEVHLDSLRGDARGSMVFDMSIDQDADGNVSGIVHGNPDPDKINCESPVAGRLRDAQTNSYSLSGEIRTPLVIQGVFYGCVSEKWSMSIVLRGETFEGTAARAGFDTMTCRGVRRVRW